METFWICSVIIIIILLLTIAVRLTKIRDAAWRSANIQDAQLVQIGELREQISVLHSRLKQMDTSHVTSEKLIELSESAEKIKNLLLYLTKTDINEPK